MFSGSPHGVWQHCDPALVPITLVLPLPPPALLCPHWGCLGTRKRPALVKGNSSTVGTLEHPVWEGDKKGWEKKSLCQWEKVRSQTSSCGQVSWVKNASTGFGAAKQPVHHLPVSASALGLLGPDLSSRLGRVLFLTWTRAPAWLKAKEQAQLILEAWSSLGCSFLLDPCNFWAITYIITSWTPHYGPNSGKCFSPGYILSTCLSSLTSRSFQSALTVPETAEDATSHSPPHTGSEEGRWTLWNQHCDSFWKQHF